MASRIKDDTYTLKVDIEIENALQQLRTIKKEVKEVVKECDYELNKLSLKRKDILVVKLNGMFKQETINHIEKELKKKLHRKVIVINNNVDFFKIESDRRRYNCGIDGKDKSFNVTSFYSDGKLIKEEIEPEYK